MLLGGLEIVGSREMMMLEIIERWAGRQRGREAAIAPMDGPLSPNSRLDELEGVKVSGADGPDDVADDGAGGLFVSVGSKICRLIRGGDLRDFVRCEGEISGLWGSGDGSVVAGVDGWGLEYFDKRGLEKARYRFPSDCVKQGVTSICSDSATGIYFSVGSRKHLAQDWVKDLMERNSEGYIAHWTLNSADKPVVVADRLAWPNGLLSERSDSSTRLLATESWSHSIRQYQGDRNGFREGPRFAANMVGYPARMCAARRGGYWLALFARRTQLVELVLKEGDYRRAMMSTLAPELWIRPTLRSTGNHLEPLQMGGIRALGIQKAWAPPRSYGLVVRFARDGRIVESLQSRVGGHAHGVTAVREIGDSVVIVSRGGRELLLMQPEAMDGALK